MGKLFFRECWKERRDAGIVKTVYQSCNHGPDMVDSAIHYARRDRWHKQDYEENPDGNEYNRY